jgi:hypothetical protein
MVGYFAPLVPKIKETSCELTIVELDGGKPGVIAVGPGLTALFFGTNLILDLNFSSSSYLMQPRLVIRYNLLCTLFL